MMQKLEIDPRMTKARATMLQRHPFWGSLALYLKFVPDPGCGSMWTDGQHLGYDPAFLETLSERELEGVQAHEVSHCAYKHHTRRGSRDHRLWNEAADYAINGDLRKAGFKLPEPHLFDKRFEGMSSEEIYAVLKKEQDQAKKQGQGSQGGRGNGPGQKPSQGSQAGQQGGKQAPQAVQTPAGAGTAPQDPQNGAGQGQKSLASWGEVRDAAPAHQKAALAGIEADWDIRVKQAVAVVSARNAGSVPADLRRAIEHAMKPKVDWRETLRRFIDDKCRGDYSWSRPNRRWLGNGFVIPGIIPNGINQIGIVIDTSGSVDAKLLAQFAAEVQASVDEGMAQRVVVIYCDARVHNKQEFLPGDTIKFDPKGGGGTRFSPALKWFADKEPDTSALIYFTDLECSDYGEEPWVPLLWMAYGPANHIADLAKSVPFGEVVHVVD